MTDYPMVDVLRVRALDGHRLWLRFTDGSEGIRDLTDTIAGGGPMVEPLKAPDYFARVFVEMGAPTWPNGAAYARITLKSARSIVSTVSPTGVSNPSKLPRRFGSSASDAARGSSVGRC